MHSEGVGGSTPTKEQKCHKICRNTDKCGAMFVKVIYLEIFAFGDFQGEGDNTYARRCSCRAMLKGGAWMVEFWLKI